MNELRKDYFLDRWVIISPSRGKRPRDFGHKKQEIKPEVCFFCPGNEELTPPEICRVEENNEWIIRVFPNKFPAATLEEWESNENFNENFNKNYLTKIPAYGEHEIIVETPDHDGEIDNLSVDSIVKVLDVCSNRANELMKNKGINYVSIFKNRGKEAGASLLHTHIQLISLPFIPTAVQAEVDASKKYLDEMGICPFCDISKDEMKTARGIFEDENAAAFTPYASRFPYEVWIMPKRHITGIDEMTEFEKYSIAKIMKNILMKLNEKADNPPYNLLFHFGVDGADLHFHIEICPRLSTWAGFELGSGITINTISPEDAAEFYKN